MNDEERRSAKRSRFDQTESEPKRSSRFDRRSRSPPNKDVNTRRSRSPMSREPFSPGSEEKRKAAVDPAAAAGTYHPTLNCGTSLADIPLQRPLRQGSTPKSKPGKAYSTSMFHRSNLYVMTISYILSEYDLLIVEHPKTASPAGKSASPPASISNINGEIYIADGDYIKDIEVNDLRNRYTLTKGSTQKMVNSPVICYPLIMPGSVLNLWAMKFLISCTLHALVGTNLKLTHGTIAHCSNPSVASADSRCVTSRSKKRLAPVRST